jgi:hypothetical protein
MGYYTFEFILCEVCIPVSICIVIFLVIKGMNLHRAVPGVIPQAVNPVAPPAWRLLRCAPEMLGVARTRPVSFGNDNRRGGDCCAVRDYVFPSSFLACRPSAGFFIFLPLPFSVNSVAKAVFFLSSSLKILRAPPALGGCT